VPAHELEAWQRRFLEAGQRGLRRKSDPEERELTLAKAKLGELMMRLELAEVLIENRGLLEKWRRLSTPVEGSPVPPVAFPQEGERRG